MTRTLTNNSDRNVCIVLNVGVDLVDYSNLDQSKLGELQKEAAKRAAELEEEVDKKKKKRKKKKKNRTKAAKKKMQQLKVGMSMSSVCVEIVRCLHLFPTN